MAKLVLSTNGAVTFQCFLDEERVYIGRKIPSQVVIDDPFVSREHAAIVQVGNDHILEDLQSANGTFVNGARIARQILQHGDVIEFGAYNLRYLNPRASSETDLDRTMIIAGLQQHGSKVDDAAVSPDSLRLASTRPVRTRVPKGRVKMASGPRARTTIELERVIAMFGKAGEQLAVLTRRPHGFFVTHVEGGRFPRVNGQSIERETRQLQRGDVVEVGEETFEFDQD